MLSARELSKISEQYDNLFKNRKIYKNEFFLSQLESQAYQGFFYMDWSDEISTLSDTLIEELKQLGYKIREHDSYNRHKKIHWWHISWKGEK